MIRKLGAAFVCVIVALAPANGQSYTDAQLVSEGQSAWDQNQCVKAAEFFFAYLLRPSSLQNPNQRRQMEGAISWCETRTSFAAGTKGDEPGGRIAPPPPAVGKAPTLNLTLPSAANQSPTQRRCDAYARVAVAQAEAYLASGCGQSNGRWDPVYANHYNWCSAADVGAAATRTETDARQRLLNSCVP